MKKLFILCFWILSSKTAFTQANELYWGERKLETSDFESKPKENLTIKSFSELKLEYKKVSFKKDNVIFRYRSFKSKFDKSKSWTTSDSISIDQLSYEQLYFDLAEANRRQIQYEFIVRPMVKKDLKYTNKWFIDELEEFRNKTENGNNKTKIEEYRKTVKNTLDSFKIADSFKYKKGYFGLEIGVGARSTILTGEMSNFIKFDPLALSIPINYRFRNVVLFTGIQYGNYTVINDFSFFGQKWFSGDKNSYLGVDLNFGFIFPIHSKYIIIPFLGVHPLIISNNRNRYFSSTPTSALGYTIGCHADFKLFQIMNLRKLNYSTNNRGYSEHNLRLSIAGNKYEFNENSSGMGISISLSYIFSKSNIKNYNTFEQVK